MLKTMFRPILRAATSLALLFSPAAFAQTAPVVAAAKDADPALWVVKDEDTTIYLFGTVHVLKPGLSWFDEAVKDAFDKSDELKLELVQPDAATMQALVMKTGLDLTGPTLSEKLPADKRAALAKVAGDLGVPMAMLDKMKPWLAAVQLGLAPLAKLGYDPSSGAEQVLSKAATDAHKQITGLETAEQQLGYFANLPEAQQIAYLLKVIEDIDRAGPELDKMVTAWAAGDPETLGNTMNEELKATPEVAKALLVDRNARWAEWIRGRMAQPGTVFIAVGAGHLAGKDSVQSFLAQHNLKVERIHY